jgi:hypothetical protein
MALAAKARISIVGADRCSIQSFTFGIQFHAVNIISINVLVHLRFRFRYIKNAVCFFQNIGESITAAPLCKWNTGSTSKTTSTTSLGNVNDDRN